mgnify:CR=1 FL=1
MNATPSTPTLEWDILPGLTPYAETLARMETRAAAIRAGQAAEAIWLVEHPPSYTAGTSARAEDLRDARFPVFEAGRGGQWVRVTRWVSWHGVALNVAPDLGHFGGIVPCGIAEHGVTSLQALGIPVSMAEVDQVLQSAWGQVFG